MFNGQPKAGFCVFYDFRYPAPACQTGASRAVVSDTRFAAPPSEKPKRTLAYGQDDCQWSRFVELGSVERVPGDGHS